MQSFKRFSLWPSFLPGSGLKGLLLGALLLQAASVQAVEVEEFFSDGENFFRARPELVADYFFGLVRLKGNPERSRQAILNEVLGCPLEASAQSNCPIQRYQIQKKEQHTPSSFLVPANFSRVEQVKTGKKLVTLRLTWRPPLIETQIIRLKAYMEALNVAWDSPYYEMPEGIERIQFAPHLQRRVEIQVEKKLAPVILELYQEAPQDNKDQILFSIEAPSVTKSGNLATFNLFLKADRVRINHLDFPAEAISEAKQ